jgi:hypothetical protein
MATGVGVGRMKVLGTKVFAAVWTGARVAAAGGGGGGGGARYNGMAGGGNGNGTTLKYIIAMVNRATAASWPANAITVFRPT